MCSYGGYQRIFNVTQSAISWQAAYTYGPQIKENSCPKRQVNGSIVKWLFMQPIFIHYDYLSEKFVWYSFIHFNNIV